MSDGVLAGWASTIALNRVETAIVAARRGHAELRFPDYRGAAPIALNRSWVDDMAGFFRAMTARGEDTIIGVEIGDTKRTRGVEIDRACVEPLVALMAEALKFSEGGNDV